MAELEPQRLIQEGGAAAASFALHLPAVRMRGPGGAWLGNESGTSIDFHEYRPYQPGDDLRRVDWGVYARSDTLVVRQYRMEVSPSIEVLLDGSASMGLYPGKAAAATFLAAFLGALSRQGGQRPVLVRQGGRQGAGQGGRPGAEQGERQGAERGERQGSEQGERQGSEQGERQGAGQGERQGAERGERQGAERGERQGAERGERLAGEAFEPGLLATGYDSPWEPLEAACWPRASGQPVRFLVTDFLFPAELDVYLGSLARDASLLVVVVILAESELEPPFQGSLRFVDAEDGTLQRDLHIDARAVRRYQQRLEAHLAGIEAACRKYRAPLVRLDVPDHFGGLEAVRERVTTALLRQHIVEGA